MTSVSDKAQRASMIDQKISTQSWVMLGLLSLIWGGSFFFVGVAVQDLPALLIVFARVGIAALILIPIHVITQGALPRDLKTWVACGGMAVLNNILPFTAISWGQHYIGSGLAAVINATTPMFGALFMAVFGLERLSLRKGIALALGLVGVIILKGGSFGDLSVQSLGILAVAFASTCYGLSTPWSKTRLVGIPPMTTATCQLTVSAVVMGLLAFGFSTPSLYFSASGSTWAALIAIASLSTAVAYLIFFKLINTAGPSFTVLVTMLVPISAVFLGVAFLHETFSAHEFVGGTIIILALIIIDGRALKRFGLKLA